MLTDKTDRISKEDGKTTSRFILTYFMYTALFMKIVCYTVVAMYRIKMIR